MPKPAWIILEVILAQVQTPSRTRIPPQEEARRLSLEVPGGAWRYLSHMYWALAVGRHHAGHFTQLISFLPDDPLERWGRLVSLYSLRGKTEVK